MDEKKSMCECSCDCKGISTGFCIVTVLASLFLGIIIGFILSPVKHGVSDVYIGSANSQNGSYNKAENNESEKAGFPKCR